MQEEAVLIVAHGNHSTAHMPIAQCNRDTMLNAYARLTGEGVTIYIGV